MMFKFKNNNFGENANSSDDEDGKGGMMMQRFQEDNDEKIDTSSAPSSQFIYIQTVQDKSVSKVFIGQDAK